MVLLAYATTTFEALDPSENKPVELHLEQAPKIAWMWYIQIPILKKAAWTSFSGAESERQRALED